MSKRPFSKLAHFFKQHFGSSRSSSSSCADVPHVGQHVQPAVHPSNPPTLRAPSPTSLPELTPSTSEEQILPSITPSISPSLQPPPCSVGYEMDSSHLTASPPSHDAPRSSSPKLTVLPPTPDPTPPQHPPAPRAPTPQLGGPAGFAGAHDFTMYKPQFNDFSLVGSGIDKLLKRSMPDAFHNSAARYPPPKCHLATRKDYIAKITQWVLGQSDRHEPILWMHGPFGIGKSAVAQSCAEALQPQNKLAATLFFSRSNADRDDPRRVFTSIAYQIAMICPRFRDIVDSYVRNDPSFATKSLSTQFNELLIHPLREIDIVRNGIEGRVVVIDGLDECRGTAEQCDIIDIIATSARNRTTPFRWFITSRPEEHIVQTMSSDDVSPVLFHFELPVSREIDHEILTYLTDEFEKIRKRHRLPMSWPSEEVLTLLVDRTAGLWIYVTTIIRFITDKNSYGPEDQLRIVLEFAKSVSGKVGEDNPLAEMDLFYALIMHQVPQKIRMTVRKILLVDTVTDWNTKYAAGAMGLSEEQFRRSCASIQSVAEFRGRDLDLHFYHASFLDFMKDPERSKELCIYGDFLIKYRRERLDWLHQVCSQSTSPSNVIFPSKPILPEAWSYNEYYSNTLSYFFRLCGISNHPLDLQDAASLEKLPFRTMLRLAGDDARLVEYHSLEQLRDNLPTELRDKIIREDKCPTPGCTNTENVWILGHGENQAVAHYGLHGELRLSNNQDPKPGWCFCGYLSRETAI